jgi:hypothetical protein
MNLKTSVALAIIFGLMGVLMQGCNDGQPYGYNYTYSTSWNKVLKSNYEICERGYKDKDEVRKCKDDVWERMTSREVN